MLFPIATPLAVLGAFALACGTPAATPPTPGSDASTTDSAQPVPTNTTVSLDGDPNGLYWDPASSTLYVADDGNNRILTYRDDTGISKYADLPAAPSNGPGLGQLVRTSDGSILVTRFGFGTTGDVVLVKPDKTSAIIPGLDPTRRRIGIVVTDAGTIYDTYFVKNGTGYVGAVASLTLQGTETDVVTGLTKVVGVLATSDTLYMDDQTQGRLFKAPLAAPKSIAAVADLPHADLLCAGPDGAIFSGGSDGNVRRIDATGVVSVFATGFAGARGVAFDAVNKRLFIANHVGKPGSNTIEIRPVP